MESAATDTLNQSILGHPALGSLIFALLCLWPLARIFRRNGQSPFLALLFLTNIIVPMTGFIFTSIAFLLKRKKVAA